MRLGYLTKGLALRYKVTVDTNFLFVKKWYNEPITDHEFPSSVKFGNVNYKIDQFLLLFQFTGPRYTVNTLL